MKRALKGSVISSVCICTY